MVAAEDRDLSLSHGVNKQNVRREISTAEKMF